MVLKREDGETIPKSNMTKALPQILAVTVKNILLMAFGLTLGYPTILIPGLTNPDEIFNIGKEGLSWIGSINLICVPIGCLISGGVSQVIGRKRSMQLVNLPFIVAWLLFYFSDEEWQIFLALAVTGLTGGFLEAPVLTYAAEISQPHLRGMLSSLSSMSVILGVMVMFLLGTFFPWRTVAVICCSFNVLSVILLFFVPESPHWLISKNRLLDARKSLAWLRGWTTLDDIEPEYKQIYREVKKEQDEGRDNPSFEGETNGGSPNKVAKKRKTRCCDTFRLFTRQNFLWPYGIISFLFVLTHFTGMSTLQTYSVQIFMTFRAPIDKYYATVILGMVDLLGTMVTVVFIHCLGKRVLSFISLVGMGLCYTGVATYAYVLDIMQLEIPNKFDYNATSNVTGSDEYVKALDAYSWVPLVLIIAFAFIAHAGIRVMPWVLIGELFSNETRSAASGICSATSYVLSFATNKVFFTIIGAFTLPGTFWAYSAISFVGCLVLYFILPETEGKTLGEITDHFSGFKKIDNKVFKGYVQDTSPVKMGTVNNGYVNDAHKFESRL